MPDQNILAMAGEVEEWPPHPPSAEATVKKERKPNLEVETKTDLLHTNSNYFGETKERQLQVRPFCTVDGLVTAGNPEMLKLLKKAWPTIAENILPGSPFGGLTGSGISVGDVSLNGVQELFEAIMLLDCNERLVRTLFFRTALLAILPPVGAVQPGEHKSREEWIQVSTAGMRNMRACKALVRTVHVALVSSPQPAQSSCPCSATWPMPLPPRLGRQPQNFPPQLRMSRSHSRPSPCFAALLNLPKQAPSRNRRRIFPRLRLHPVRWSWLLRYQQKKSPFQRCKHPRPKSASIDSP